MTNHQTLFESVNDSIQSCNLSQRTEKSYTDWIYRFIAYHHKRHPSEMGVGEVSQFLSYLHKDCNKSASTQNQALCALSFLYKEVLKHPLPPFKFVRAKKVKHLPAIYSRSEIASLLSQLSGIEHLMAGLLYGAGLRVMEVIQLRIKDIDLQSNQIHIRPSEKELHRTSLLPLCLKALLAEQIYQATLLYQQDVKSGFGQCSMVPQGQKAAETQLASNQQEYYLFPSARRIKDTESGQELRHHVHESVLQKAVKEAIAKAGLNREGSCHSLRHSFAVHVLESGCKIEKLKELLGHQDLRTTMLYMQIIETKTMVVQSPLDLL